MKKRLFIAIDVPKRIKGKIVELQKNLKTNLQNAIWVRPDNIHLTLVFLDDTDYNQIPEIISTLAKLKDDAFWITFTNIDGFPHLSRAHTIWIGVQDNLGLFYLHKKIAERLRKLNLRIDEKKFIPHITLARIKKAKNVTSALATFNKINLGKFKVKEFILFESELNPEGPKHKSIKKFSLENGGNYGF